MEPISTNAIVELLVEHWHARSACLPTYFQTHFDYRLERSLPFDCLVLLQMSDGDIASRSIGRDALRKWEYYSDRLHSVTRDHAWEQMYKTDQMDELFLSPVFIFFLDGHQLLLSERFGPNLTHRLLGEVSVEANKLLVAWTTVWCTAAR